MISNKTDVMNIVKLKLEGSEVGETTNSGNFGDDMVQISNEKQNGLEGKSSVNDFSRLW